MSKDNPGYEDLAKFKVKNAIVAPEGWTLVCADQSQCELRIAGALSNDPILKQSYIDEIDVHSLVH